MIIISIQDERIVIRFCIRSVFRRHTRTIYFKFQYVNMNENHIFNELDLYFTLFEHNYLMKMKCSSRASTPGPVLVR